MTDTLWWLLLLLWAIGFGLTFANNGVLEWIGVTLFLPFYTAYTIRLFRL